MIKDLFILSFRSLTRRKLRSWLTLLGIFIGIAAVVSLIGLGNGLRSAITSQFSLVGPDVISVQANGGGQGPPGQGVVDPLTLDLSDAIEDVRGVEIAIPRMVRTAEIEFDDKVTFSFIGSVPDGDRRQELYRIINLDIEEGRLLKDGEVNRIVIGHNYAQDDNPFQKALTLGDKLTLNGKQFQVVGILEKKGSFILDGGILANEQAMRDLFDEDEEVDLMAVVVKNQDEINEVAEDIKRVMRKERDVKEGEENFEVSTPQATLQNLDSILAGVQSFIILVAAISILVGAVGIINTMFTAVAERKREIGIMKAIGAKNSTIFLLFFFESGLLGSVGGLVGIILGSIIAYMGTLGINNWLGATTAPGINLMLIIGSLLGSFIIGSFAGVLPAMRASRLRPVDNIRG